MGWAGEYADSIRSLWGIEGIVTNETIEQIYEDLGIEREIVPWLPAGLPEVLIGHRLQILESLDKRGRRYSLCHSLPHIIIHNGSQYSLDPGWIARQEHQCDQFVLMFISGGVIPRDCDTPHLVAEFLDLPLEFVHRVWPMIQSMR